MSFPIYTVDAFTLEGQTFSGNPAAVCVLEFDDDISDDMKQKIASQMNLSETAFVAKGWNKGSTVETNTYTLRWFSPTKEVTLCGHATIASASVVCEEKSLKFDTTFNKIKFETKFKGILEAIVNRDEQSITLDFSVSDCQPLEDTHNEWISDLIKHTLGPNLTEDVVQEVQYSSDVNYILLRLKDRSESQELIYKVNPNVSELSKINSKLCLKVIIATQKGQNNEFLSRIFAPFYGIDEDPACGSAHTVLAPYWLREYVESGLTLNEVVGRQCSRRGGIIKCKIVGQRVLLTGNYKILIKGNLYV